MPVPKKRVGHSEQGHRRSNWKATVPAISKCPNCGAPRHPHTMCGACGFYKDRIVLKSLADDDFEMPTPVAETEEAAATEETTVAEEPKAEEVAETATEETEKDAE